MVKVARLQMLFLAVTVITLPACEAASSSGDHCDWASFLVHDGIEYHSLDVPVELGAINEKVGEVRHEVRSDECERELRDGDAAHVPAGSGIVSLEKYDPSFRLGVETREGTTLYQVSRNDAATKGGDLLPIDGLVVSIRVIEPAWVAGGPRGRTTLGLVKDPEVIDRLVQSILAAPVDYERFPREESGVYDAQVYLAIRLSDGTTLHPRYWPGFSGRIDPGIFLPEQFRKTLAAALGANGERLYEIEADERDEG